MKHFHHSEFDSPDKPGSGKDMDATFLSMLDEARELSGCAYRITSGYRTQTHNKKVGGASKSSHLIGHAADIAAPDSASRYKIIRGLILAGFTRIGVGRTFIHCDNDPGKAPRVMWHYYK